MLEQRTCHSVAQKNSLEIRSLIIFGANKLLQVTLPDASATSTISLQNLGFVSAKNLHESAKCRPGVSTVWLHYREDKAFQLQHVHRGRAIIRKSTRNAASLSNETEEKTQTFGGPAALTASRRQTGHMTGVT